MVKTNQPKIDACTYIYNAQEEDEMKFSYIPPPPPKHEPEKTWHGLSRNQGVEGKHDEQYQMSTGTSVSYGLNQNRWYPALQLSQSNI